MTREPFAGEVRPIYADFYGMSTAPFELTPNPRFLFLTPRLREALSNLRYALTHPKGLTLLLGSPGMGKTTLIRAALDTRLPAASRYVLLSNPMLDRTEFYEYLARELELSADAARSKARFLFELGAQVEERRASGGLTVLIIDEAQSLADGLLEEIRLLGNIETTTTKLLNIMLAGQPELADRLNQPALRQLKQRIALRCELGPLSLQETAAYISGRLRIAGAQPQDVFTRETVVAIHGASTGIPRVINVICENALVGGFAAQVKPIPLSIVAEVCSDFDIPSVAPAGNALEAAKPTAALVPRTPRQTDLQKQGAAEASGERELFGAIGQPAKRRLFFF